MSVVTAEKQETSLDNASRTRFRIHQGLLKEAKPVNIIFNNKRYTALTGDTLASALLANGQQLVGRSFKYHRPRGIFSAGPEEPNALVTLRTGAYSEPNTRATVTEVFEGLEARSQNHLGSLDFDLMAVNDCLSAFLSAGFYYKTFMWPKSFWEKLYEPLIRSAAGLGSLSMLKDPDEYDKGYLHTDLLVIGAGAAGLTAALVAGRAGLRVLLVDEDFLAGGRLNFEQCHVDGLPGSEWASAAMAELATLPSVRILLRTTVYGAFDHGIFGALQRCTDHLPGGNGKVRQILWRIYSRRTLLCSGSTERSIAFGNNDRPGIMLAGSVRAYLNRFGVSPGQQVAVFTNNDDGWRTAKDLYNAGVQVSAVIDTRDIKAPVALAGVPVFMGNRVIDTTGRLGLCSVTLVTGETIRCDCLAVAGGWNPNVHLTCHQRTRPVWRESIAAFVPATDLPAGLDVAGAANGEMTLSLALASGHASALGILHDAGFKGRTEPAPAVSGADEKSGISACWQVSASTSRAWVDLQNDVTTKDLALSHKEGFRSVEHAKRYTTLGMATDQGKTSNVTGLAVLAELSGKSVAEMGTTVFRPPYTPVAIAALAGRARGKSFRPVRYPPSHAWAKSNGAAFVETGAWLRAQWYARTDENHWRQSVDREVRQTRSAVGICDVSTLGKIDVQGRDAAAFLDFIYANTFSTLPVGRVRYGLMLREDGFVMDDGTGARLADNHFILTTSTAHDAAVLRHMEFCRQCLLPEMDVHLVSVTDQWAQFAIAGPDSRRLLTAIVDEPDVISRASFPFMACTELTVCNGTAARLFRISFSGELAFELAVPARVGHALLNRLMEAGKPFGVTPYGTEALGVMRIEKGYVAGNEINGQTTAANLGLARLVGKNKDCIGKTLSLRSALSASDGLRLVGLMPTDGHTTLRAGAHLLARNTAATLDNDQGWITSAAYSPTLDSPIALGFLQNGALRLGEQVVAHDPLRGADVDVTVVSAQFLDPQGERARG